MILRFIGKAWRRYVEFHTRAPFKHYYLTLIGLVTFPAYYFVWTYLFPQPYESLGLRLAGVAMCAAYLLRDRWPAFLKPWHYHFTYVSMMAGLPVFFTYMALKNHASPAWLLSTMAAFVFVVHVYDTFNVFIVTILGSLLGIGWFFLTDGVQPLPDGYLVCIPVFLFTLMAVVALTYGERRIAHEQYTAASLLASNIAHEMRTPLLGIRLDCERLIGDLQTLASTAAWARAHGCDGPQLTENELRMAGVALARIRGHAVGANTIIEMLLNNVAHDRIRTDDFSFFTFREIIDNALQRFHFRAGERERVSVTGDLDARFWGSDHLFTHVIFNLLRNAIKAIEARGSGSIAITVDAMPKETLLTFSDTGAGIPPELLPVIFIPFVTGGSRMHGTGIGLSFCRLVIESFGGTIHCHSEVGAGTTFTVRLPRPHEQSDALLVLADRSAQ